MKTIKDHEGPKLTKFRRKMKSPSPKIVDNFYGKKECISSDQSSQSFSYGVLGIGRLGSTLVINLIKSGNKVYIWNRTNEKCKKFVHGLDSFARSLVEICHIPSFVMQRSNIIFNCISDCNGSKNVINNSLAKDLTTENFMLNKGLIDMSGLDPDGHKELSELVKNKGGKYLEVRIQFREDMKGGGYLFLVGGDADLFSACQPCFNTLSGTCLYLGDKVG